MNKKVYGFTIVELLIVIVVIAILAAISIAAYTNIQQRAKNTAIINAASQSLKMIEAYIAANGTYPAKGSQVYSCITADSGCHSGGPTPFGASLTFSSAMATIGVLPKSVPSEGTSLYGVAYIYEQGDSFNSESQPARLTYFLLGVDQQCGLPGVMMATATSGERVSSTTGYSNSNMTSDKTVCHINIPGQAHS